MVIPTRRVIQWAGKLKKWGLQQIDTKIVLKLKFEDVSCVQISIWVYFRKELDLKYRFAGRNSRSIVFSPTKSKNKNCTGSRKKWQNPKIFENRNSQIFLMNFVSKRWKNRKKAKISAASGLLAERSPAGSQNWIQHEKMENFWKNWFFVISLNSKAKNLMLLISFALD